MCGYLCPSLEHLLSFYKDDHHDILVSRNMAVCKTKPSSTTFSNSRQIQDSCSLNRTNSSFLYLLQDNSFWKGDVESLKEFINTVLQTSGRWSSPRGETTQFSNPEFCLKWHGPTAKKLTIVQGNEEEQLLVTLKSYATLPKPEDEEYRNNPIDHVACVVI